MSSNSDRGRRVIGVGFTSCASLKLHNTLVRELSAAGFACAILSDCAEQVGPLDRDIATFWNIPMVRKIAPFRDLWSLAHWLRALAVIKPDIVFLSTPKASFLGLLASWFLRVRVRVYLVRGLRYESLSRLPRRVNMFVEKLSCSLATHSLSVSESVTDSMVRDGITTEATRPVVLGRGSSKGVNLEDIPPPVANPKRQLINELKIGFVGRITHDKGVRVLLSAHKILLERQIPHSITFFGEDEGDGPLLKEVTNSAPNVDWVTTASDPKEIFPNFDVLCLPSYREGFPNVVLEAAAYSIPTVGCRSTGLVDAVIDGQTGLLTAPGNAKDLAASLERLQLDSDLLAALGASARSFVEDHYREHEVLSRYIDFLKSA